VIVAVVTLLVVSVLLGVAVIVAVHVQDRREQRAHDAAPPNNRVVGSDDQRHNRIFD
jgi:hypothetical protein